MNKIPIAQLNQFTKSKLSTFCMTATILIYHLRNKYKEFNHLLCSTKQILDAIEYNERNIITM